MTTFGSLFSGAGGMDYGLERAGLTCAYQVENDKWAQAVLQRHWPAVPKWGDITTVDPADLPYADVIAFGFPCTDLSVAGKQAGLGGSQSSLFWEGIRIVKAKRPELVIIENVPGLLHFGDRGIGVVLTALAELGAVDIGWRVFDSRYFGVAQRRRRVFIVTDFGGQRAGEILALSEGGGGDTPKGRRAGQDIAGTLGGGSGSRGWSSDTDRMTFVAQAVSENQHAEVRLTSYVRSLNSAGGKVGQGYQAALTEAGVRRLTPRECERLQAVGDDFTRWTDDNREIPDSHRYRMCGNMVTVSVAQWLGERVKGVLA